MFPFHFKSVWLSAIYISALYRMCTWNTCEMLGVFQDRRFNMQISTKTKPDFKAFSFIHTPLTCFLLLQIWSTCHPSIHCSSGIQQSNTLYADDQSRKFDLTKLLNVFTSQIALEHLRKYFHSKIKLFFEALKCFHVQYMYALTPSDDWWFFQRMCCSVSGSYITTPGQHQG